MKQTLRIIGICSLLLSASSIRAQILLEHVYSTNDDVFSLVTIDSGEDYYLGILFDSSVSRFEVKLYKLDHSLKRDIHLPSEITKLGLGYGGIDYVTRHLFDPDDSIEFVATALWNGVPSVLVLSESGRVLVRCDSCVLAENCGWLGWSAKTSVFTTSVGTKLLLMKPPSTNPSVTLPEPLSFVYSLPGKLPVVQHSAVKPDEIGITDRNTGSVGAPYPNPSSSAIRIEYALPEGATTADLILTDLTGKECKRYRVGNAFNDILINPGELASGTYFYSLVSRKGRSEVRKLVIEKEH